MRTEAEGFSNWPERPNLAYKTYASLWLDFVDDNVRHFYWRDKDISPLKEAGIDILKMTEWDKVYEVYVKAAIKIAKATIQAGFWKTFEDLYEAYPLLAEYKDVLEREVYDVEN